MRKWKDKLIKALGGYTAEEYDGLGKAWDRVVDHMLLSKRAFILFPDDRMEGVTITGDVIAAPGSSLVGCHIEEGLKL